MEDNVFSELKERGLIDDVTSDEIFKLGRTSFSVYAGFDPTSDSLHLGNLVGIVVLGWFERYGHKTIAIAGGATGMIGDPSGKSQERVLLDQESIGRNLIGIQKSLSKVLKESLLLNNYDWFQKFGYIEFLRDVGKFFRIGIMLSKESVKARLNSDEGLSYTEFSYQLLQAYDFLHLFDHYGTLLQVGGSDQWGNITAGTEFIRKVRGKTVHGLTFPLLTRSDGKKFGKSEEGAIWLNSEKLSPYDFYQYLYRVSDQDVIKLMRMITFMDLKEIHEIENSMKSSNYTPQLAQKRLALEVTQLIHGEEGVKIALEITSQAQPGAKTSLDPATLETLSKELPGVIIPFLEFIDRKLIDLIVQHKLIASKSEGRRLVENGGLYINNEKVVDENYVLKKKDLIAEKFVLLGIGKKKKIVMRIEDR